MSDFILEIGTEELPSRFLVQTEKQLMELFKTGLDEFSLPYGEIIATSTPRRLGVFIGGLAEYQDKKEELLTGPPLKAAYDANNQATPALLGFLKAHNARLEDIFAHETAKGSYIAIKREMGGKSAYDILKELCPKILSSISFPKRMRWGSEQQAFARPIHSLLALLDNQIVEFEFAGIKSGRVTCGHRVHANRPVEVQTPGEYYQKVREAGIEPSRQKRLEKIVKEGDRLAAGIGGKIAWKDDLLEEVSGLVEYPVALIGKFDPSYLELPPEVLLTSMQHHQKSFGVLDSDGKLLPAFLTVINLDPTDENVVRKGWERVLKARLEDARFFWNSDLATPMDEWRKKLMNVIFIGPLGNMAEKTERLQKLAAWIAEKIFPAGKDDAVRAAALAKADLLSGMVGEFDSLQGIMGGIYASKAGENARVSLAIQEQYLPSGPDSPLPASKIGAILSIAGNMDTLVGCFGLDMIPGGAADPHGARRSALAIIRILENQKWDLPLPELIDYARKIYGERKWKLSSDEARSKLLSFIKTRLRHYFLGLAYETALVDSVLAVEDGIAASEARLQAMAEFSKSANFLEYAQILKRIENILKKSDPQSDISAISEDLLQENAERVLYEALRAIEPEVENLLAQKNYASALDTLEKLRAPVADFFEKVMVNSDKPELKKNRLLLLAAIKNLYAPIAAFNLLQI